jgi:hypothetical protein
MITALEAKEKYLNQRKIDNEIQKKNEELLYDKFFEWLNTNINNACDKGDWMFSFELSDYFSFSNKTEKELPRILSPWIIQEIMKLGFKISIERPNLSIWRFYHTIYWDK